MELDSRIIEGKKPLTCIDTEQAKEFLGKECYFSNCKSHYKNLSAFEKYVTLTDYCIGTLTAIMELGDRVFDVDQQCKEFRYCLPCEWVNPEEPEKKYREYKDLDEFFDVTGLEIGDLIKLKFPGNNVAELLIVGGCNNGLFIGIHKYTFKQLFEMVEISISGEWQLFGVLDKEGVRE